MLPIHSGHPDRRLVHVGDLALRADRHQGVPAGLDQAAGVLRRRTELLLGQPGLRDVVAHQQEADRAPQAVVTPGHHDAGGEPGAILPDSLELFLGQTILIRGGQQAVDGTGLDVCWHVEDARVPAHDLFRGIAVVAERSLVPRKNAVVQVHPDDRVLRGALQYVVQERPGFGKLSQLPFRIGGIAGRVLVYRRGVEHPDQLAVGLPEDQRIVGDEAVRENLALTRADPVRLGEIVREVSADQMLPVHSDHLDRRLVHIGDLPLGADRHQRVRAGLHRKLRPTGGLGRAPSRGGGGGFAIW